jgi:hypothetical protein
MSRQQLIDEPAEALPEAAQLLAGYFHQDWVLDGGRWEDVVDGFVAESPGSAVVGATADLRTLLAAGFGDVELAGVLDRLGASVDPAADGLTATGWLEAVLARLETRTSR